MRYHGDCLSADNARELGLPSLAPAFFYRAHKISRLFKGLRAIPSDRRGTRRNTLHPYRWTDSIIHLISYHDKKAFKFGPREARPTGRARWVTAMGFYNRDNNSRRYLPFCSIQIFMIGSDCLWLLRTITNLQSARLRSISELGNDPSTHTRKVAMLVC